MLLWLIAILDWRVLILRHFSGQILPRFEADERVVIL